MVTRQSLELAALAAGAVLARGHRGRRVVRELSARQIMFSGVHAVGLVTFLGAVTGLFMLVSLVVLFPGASNQAAVARAVTHLLVREVGPLATIVILILRSCSAVVVELGYMRTQGELDAMEAAGLDPVRLVLVPRFAGLIVAAFGLTVLFLVVAFGTGVVATVALGRAPGLDAAVARFVTFLRPADLVLSLSKAVAYGVTVAALSCRYGLTVPRDLTRIPPAVTRALVSSLLACVVVGAALTLASL